MMVDRSWTLWKFQGLCVWTAAQAAEWASVVTVAGSDHITA